MSGIFGPSMSEYVIAHILALERHILHYADVQRALHTVTTSPALGAAPATLWDKRLFVYRTLAELNVGVMGVTGSIGRAMARRFSALGMRVRGFCLRRPRTPGITSPLATAASPVDSTGAASPVSLPAAAGSREEWDNPADRWLPPFERVVERIYAMEVCFSSPSPVPPTWVSNGPCDAEG